MRSGGAAYALATDQVKEILGRGRPFRTTFCAASVRTGVRARKGNSVVSSDQYNTAHFVARATIHSWRCNAGSEAGRSRRRHLWRFQRDHFRAGQWLAMELEGRVVAGTPI